MKTMHQYISDAYRDLPVREKGILQFCLHEKNHADYLTTMSHLFAEDDLVYDFNTSEYREFRSDLTNYIDHGHLSEKGAAFIAAELDRVIKSMPHASSDQRILP